MKCENCGANLVIDENNEKAFCQYCRTAFTVGNDNTYTKRIVPPSHKRMSLYVEKAKVIILSLIFFPIAVVLFILGVALGLGAGEFDMLIGFWVAGLIAGGIPFLLKSSSVEKRMKKQLYRDGFEIINYYKFISNSPDYPYSYFITCKNNAWIIWQQRGIYDVYSKLDVSKCEEIAGKNKNNEGIEICSLLKLIISFKNENRAVEISFIKPENNEKTTSQNYITELQKAKDIKTFFDSENVF